MVLVMSWSWIWLRFSGNGLIKCIDKTQNVNFACCMYLQNLHFHNFCADECLTQLFQNFALPTVNNHWHIFLLFEPILIHLSLHFCQWSGGIFLCLVTQDCSSTFSSAGFYSAGKWVRFVEHDWIKIVPGLYFIYVYAAGK